MNRQAISRAAAAAMLFFWACGLAGAGEKLNVIIVSVDLLRTDRLAAYGGGKGLAPNIDAFHNRSVVFLNAISPSSWTLPAAVSAFTGLYPKQHKITNIARKTDQGRMEPSRLAPGIVTLPEVFKRNGYETGYFVGGEAIWENFGLERGAGFIQHESQKITDSFRLAKSWFDKRSDKRPFFLFIQGFDLLHWETAPGLDKYGNAELEMNGIAVYDQRVGAVDTAFGDFIAFLEKKGLLENTVVVFLSHHGEGLGVDSHGPPTHAIGLYDEFIRVPLMIYRPGTPHAAISSQVSLIDLGPTLIAAAGLGNDRKFAAQALGTALYPFAGKSGACRSVMSEIEAMYVTEQISVRTCPGWKLIYNFQISRSQLYNLAADPGELKDLYEREPLMAGVLEKELFDWLIK